jgi:methionyl-tRNA formyltransferase
MREAPGTILRAYEEGIVVSCGEGELALEILQLEGATKLTARQILNAHQSQFAAGGRFDLPIELAG